MPLVGEQTCESKPGAAVIPHRPPLAGSPAPTPLSRARRMPSGPDQIPSVSGKIPVSNNGKNLCSLNSCYRKRSGVSSLLFFIASLPSSSLRVKRPWTPHIDQLLNIERRNRCTCCMCGCCVDGGNYFKENLGELVLG